MFNSLFSFKPNQRPYGSRFNPKQLLMLLLLLLEAQFVTQLTPVTAQTDVPTTVEPSPDTAPTICPADLKASIDAIANRPEFDYARWGILIQPLFSDTPLYSRERDRYFIPASNLKLFTTAAALSQLGANFRIRTSVYGTPTEGTIPQLRVVGRGDPSLNTDQLKDLAQQLRRQGIRRVDQLIVEDRYFSEPKVNPTWEWSDIQFYYGTAVNSLILNENAVLLTLTPQTVGQPLTVTWADPIAAKQWQIENQTVTTEAEPTESINISGVLGKPLLRIRGQLAADAGLWLTAVAIPDPANYFLQHFRRALADSGIQVERGLVTTEPNFQEDTELAAVDSPPLSELIAETNQQSNNLYAEALLRSLGVTDKEADESTATAGREQIRASLAELGVEPESYVLADGSGLSRHNLVSPTAIVQTLQAIARTPMAQSYLDSLAVAGVEGTLRQRFQNTPAQGRVYAKTGTMTGVSALSGYVEVPDYQPLVFSIMVNQSNQSVSTIRQAIDEIVVLLSRLRSC
ncbi:D-alanyl-D-alanine carboxypeptidase/D-alanyl-D-alanine-endopeptidase [Coleofasciculus chthonoplastes PCC 7420]|uniref:D-alanyl-D-alanine carboxypeptidase/D-alanyl-D-alanine-endopeptidase n=1 Tax=Coleofasciculus chthonoplastes PCC 7420 TaxID=118168 RepID=B4W3H6_9CYAN|nr:D-alanyl-D-alanine carboxypeptidase/D-alanyl-D-alanine-endopeptidase [Coleofasciculus chthonoplastes]EDX71264.1 D-alanyl-D-alanine carboxypeptidase/D-alanyl-D-alanine-endopeptidase [Coleofasciculus chthonoplastes PCC 7420]